MGGSRVLFVLLAGVTLGAAVRVVTHRVLFHAALWLIVAFAGIAGIYLLLASPFMAGVQLFIYIGGVAVLTTIAVMVTKGMMRRDLPTTSHAGSAALVAVALFAVQGWMIVQLPLPAAPPFPPLDGELALLGAALVDPQGFLLPFEVVSVLLLSVLLGALYLARER